MNRSKDIQNVACQISLAQRDSSDYFLLVEKIYSFDLLFKVVYDLNDYNLCSKGSLIVLYKDSLLMDELQWSEGTAG